MQVSARHTIFPRPAVLHSISVDTSGSFPFEEKHCEQTRPIVCTTVVFLASDVAIRHFPRRTSADVDHFGGHGFQPSGASVCCLGSSLPCETSRNTVALS